MQKFTAAPSRLQGGDEVLKKGLCPRLFIIKVACAAHAAMFYNFFVSVFVFFSFLGGGFKAFVQDVRWFF